MSIDLHAIRLSDEVRGGLLKRGPDEILFIKHYKVHCPVFIILFLFNHITKETKQGNLIELRLHFHTF